MTGNYAFAGIDMALWDLCGKDCGKPLYRLFGGALRSEVDYFCYLAQGTPESLRQQCESAVRRGYSCFYLKVGIDGTAEERMLEAIRGGGRRRRQDPHRRQRGLDRAGGGALADPLAHRVRHRFR